MPLFSCRGGQTSSSEEGCDQEQDQSCWEDGSSFLCSQVCLQSTKQAMYSCVLTQLHCYTSSMTPLGCVATHFGFSMEVGQMSVMYYPLQGGERGGAGTERPDPLRPAPTWCAIRGEGWTLNW